jgi:homoserine dehydrogenase
MSEALALAHKLQPRVAISLLGTGQVGSALLHQLAEGEERGDAVRIV